jgi:hypothetical protein
MRALFSSLGYGLAGLITEVVTGFLLAVSSAWSRYKRWTGYEPRRPSRPLNVLEGFSKEAPCTCQICNPRRLP